MEKKYVVRAFLTSGQKYTEIGETSDKKKDVIEMLEHSIYDDTHTHHIFGKGRKIYDNSMTNILGSYEVSIIEY